MNVIAQIQDHLEETHLLEEVELSGCMCTGDCRRGVCVRVDGQLFSVTADNVKNFIHEQIDRRLLK